MMRVSLCEMEELISEGPRIHPPGRIQGGEERRGKGFGRERSANEPNPHSKKLFTHSILLGPIICTLASISRRAHRQVL